MLFTFAFAESKKHIFTIVESFTIGSLEDLNAFRSNLEFKSIYTAFVGKYYCVYNDSIKDETETDYDDDVEKFKASSIYVFVDGE